MSMVFYIKYRDFILKQILKQNEKKYRKIKKIIEKFFERKIEKITNIYICKKNNYIFWLVEFEVNGNKDKFRGLIEILNDNYIFHYGINKNEYYGEKKNSWMKFLSRIDKILNEDYYKMKKIWGSYFSIKYIKYFLQKKLLYFIGSFFMRTEIINVSISGYDYENYSVIFNELKKYIFYLLYKEFIYVYDSWLIALIKIIDLMREKFLIINYEDSVNKSVFEILNTNGKNYGKFGIENFNMSYIIYGYKNLSLNILNYIWFIYPYTY